ncbi:hypothetical protein Acr_00g0102830 [Actinidia rufa]|uniref:Uncharacterized protein n=1 Tax=Actinidia rufa TaxID=165716 RepID=A0A7J0E0S1_9ERIC|nr:hypothetical protein Acr_00g0102830 [Actinidia rufa]
MGVRCGPYPEPHEKDVGLTGPGSTMFLMPCFMLGGRPGVRLPYFPLGMRVTTRCGLWQTVDQVFFLLRHTFPGKSMCFPWIPQRKSRFILSTRWAGNGHS